MYGENKDADQLRNYCAADMYHCFVHMQKGWFSLPNLMSVQMSQLSRLREKMIQLKK